MDTFAEKQKIYNVKTEKRAKGNLPSHKKQLEK